MQDRLWIDQNNVAAKKNGSMARVDSCPTLDLIFSASAQKSLNMSAEHPTVLQQEFWGRDPSPLAEAYFEDD
jgi:hypothetical protein